MSSQTLPMATSEGPATNYDPAYNTLRFDILAVLSAIESTPETDLCTHCRHTVLRTARRAFDAILDTEPAELTTPTGRQIRHAFLKRDTGTLHFTTISTPGHPRTNPIPVADAITIRNFLSPTHHETLLDALLKPLSESHDDNETLNLNLNLAQTQLWFCLAGTAFTLHDAILGRRSLAAFAHTHGQLLTNLTRGLRTCYAGGPDSTCFGLPVPEAFYYLYAGDVALQSRAAVRAALKRMDGPVAGLVEGQLLRSWEWPEAVRTRYKGCSMDWYDEEEGGQVDWVEVLAAVEKMPAFRARMVALREREEYKRLEETVAEGVREWREGEGRRRAAGIVGAEGKKGGDRVEGTRRLMEGLVQQLIVMDAFKTDEPVYHGE
ncbi:hypothetical protein C8A00DRAFT_32289 [Chaetomidium leptoderma]|uniref:Uncharacterized protein n=1 Tax=Chaetomidium leptoderma TaxID=669021 RepID=A0AAN6VQB4_9PEZI|nr:hypothetical protein C8A00DRAFT_32289 [Chaetomidium leptoderma]